MTSLINKFIYTHCPREKKDDHGHGISPRVSPLKPFKYSNLTLFTSDLFKAFIHISEKSVTKNDLHKKQLKLKNQ